MPSRSEYLAEALPDPGERPDGGKWCVIRVWKLEHDGLVPQVDVKPEYFDIDFIAQETAKIDRERVQLIPSSHDSGKAYFFGREQRQYVFQGFVYDSSTGLQNWEAALTRGMGGYTKFKRLYDQQYRASKALENKRILEIDLDQFRLWGFMTNCTGTHASDSPNMYVITFGFYVEAMEVKGGSYARLGRRTWALEPETFNTIFRRKYQVSNESYSKIGLDDYLEDDSIPRIRIPANQSVVRPPSLPASQIEAQIRTASIRLASNPMGLGTPPVRPKRKKPAPPREASQITLKGGIDIGPNIPSADLSQMPQ